MANKYTIHCRFTDEIIEVEQRKLSIRDGYLTVNGAKMGEKEQVSLIIPLNSISFIEETPDSTTPIAKKDAGNIKQWKFGTPFPED